MADERSSLPDTGNVASGPEDAALAHRSTVAGGGLKLVKRRRSFLGWGALHKVRSFTVAGNEAPGTLAFPSRISEEGGESSQEEVEHSTALGEAEFGGKTIGFWGGFSLLVNNATGPGLVAIPLVFQQSGMWPTLIMFILGLALAAICSQMLCEAMARLPGNAKFNERVEFTLVIKHFFPKWAFYLSLIVLCFSFTVINVASIIESAQTMDNTLIAATKHTYALEIYPSFGFRDVTHPSLGDSPFGNAYVISLGFLVVLAMSIPMGYFNLDDNIWVQKVAMAALTMCLAVWVAQFGSLPLDANNIPAATNAIGSLFSNVLINYAFVTTIPSWVNEKMTDVSIGRSVWGSSFAATLCYVVLGVVGGYALHISGNDDLLATIEDTKSFWELTRVMAYIFPLAALVTSIPIYSIIIRYNLLENKVCSKPVSNILAVLLPWVMALFFYVGDGIQNLLTWSTLLIQPAINFLVPLLVYMRAQKEIIGEQIIEKRMSRMSMGKRVDSPSIAPIKRSTEKASFMRPRKASIEQSLLDAAATAEAEAEDTNSQDASQNMDTQPYRALDVAPEVGWWIAMTLFCLVALLNVGALTIQIQQTAASRSK